MLIVMQNLLNNGIFSDDRIITRRSGDMKFSFEHKNLSPEALRLTQKISFRFGTRSDVFVIVQTVLEASKGKLL